MVIVRVVIVVLPSLSRYTFKRQTRIALSSSAGKLNKVLIEFLGTFAISRKRGLANLYPIYKSFQRVVVEKLFVVFGGRFSST